MIKYQNLNIIEYSEALQYQEKLFAKLIENEQHAGYLLFCEHPHVFTLGKNGQKNNFLIDDKVLKEIKASYFQTNRGGDITYHGPGQLVGYPVLNLKYLNVSVKDYIYNIEETIIRTIAEYGIVGYHYKEATGVWLDIDKPNKIRKICAIGVKMSRFVTMHGFALNVNTNLDYFNYINPCGFTDKGVTSMEQELGYKLDFNKVKQQVKYHFFDIFNTKLIE
jgi:lipoyl(octanoyl) transferase